jgi:peptidoglycan/xylan/chitin deacetylase (PgdA/CDA1 family)
MTAFVCRVPILAYHSVSDGPPPLCVSPARFAEHLSSLRDAGWSSLTLDDLLAGFARGGWPPRRVMLTFDDGLASFGSLALPQLVRVGFSAILFVVAGRIGGETDWRGWPTTTPRERLLDVGALADAAASGIEIGAHAVSHVRLSTLGLDAAADEVLTGRRRLEDLLQCRVRSFAYPFGDAPAAVAGIVREHFSAGFGIRLAYASPGSRLELIERIDAYYLRRRRSLAGLSRWTTRAELMARGAARELRRATTRGRS